MGNKNLIILDGSLETKANNEEFEKFGATIPNSRRFDLKNVFRDKLSPYPNTVPKSEIFELECRKIGINQNSEIIVFDNGGIYSSPRVWWLFKIMGHQKVSVLDGGLPNWIEMGFRTEKEHIEDFDLGNFKVNYDKNLFVKFEQVKANISHQKFLIVDARPKSRFDGTGKEPRKNLKSGKIENSINIPYQTVLQNGRYKRKNELKELFDGKCQGENELVFSCGSGMTACIVMLASKIADRDNCKIFDGSWTEWAERNNLKENVV